MKVPVFFYLLFWSVQIGCYAPTIEGEKPIVIVIPSYNNAPWYEFNLRSAFAQKKNYSNFRIIYCDDASTDGTGDLVESYVAQYGSGIAVTLIHNQTNMGALANISKAIATCHNNEIIVTLDGDDWFAHDRVLSRINEAYSDSSVWMSYGQFEYWPEKSLGMCQLFPDFVCETNAYREYPWIASHLRTFYAGLFKYIAVEDLFYNGSYFSIAWDLAIMFPLLEMSCGHTHCAFIEDVLYIHNRANPLSDSSVDSYPLQRSMAMYIRKKKKYSPINENEFYDFLER